MRVINGIEIRGQVIDGETRCAHYNGPLDIIAIKFKCCGNWYPCRECHDNSEAHAAEVWPQAYSDAAAILCGACGHQMSVNNYLSCNSICPMCNARFNPRCSDHYHLYFEMEL